MKQISDFVKDQIETLIAHTIEYCVSNHINIAISCNFDNSGNCKITTIDANRNIASMIINKESVKMHKSIFTGKKSAMDNWLESNILISNDVQHMLQGKLTKHAFKVECAGMGL